MSSMTSPASQVAERYSLSLGTSWRNWLDRDSLELVLPGAMRQIPPIEELIAEAPPSIWAGFMLPDSLPLVGNEYGDWICVRVRPDDTLGELIYWYHGGGDWIPVGSTMAEAILHDAVDQFREPQKQGMRGASESRIEPAAASLSRLTSPELLEFLKRELPSVADVDLSTILQEICQVLSQTDYSAALDILLRHGWAIEAVASDLAETLLQHPVRELARSVLAEELNVAWFPDFVRLLFDFSLASLEQREHIITSSQVASIPNQNWLAASQHALAVMGRRQDLGWATTIAGWAAERAGNFELAAATYWQGRYASAFTDQSVRFNSHAIADDCKFALARLNKLKKFLPAEQREDDYLQAFSGERSPLTAVQSYWTRRAETAASDGDHAEAYRCYFAAGWDMGVSRLSEYEEILLQLTEHARRCGWQGRASVAETHLKCLQRSMRR